jgi:hypothetical protein
MTFDKSLAMPVVPDFDPTKWTPYTRHLNERVPVCD